MKEIPPSTERPAAESSGPIAWLTPWRFAGILAVLFLVCFPLVVLGFEAFVYGDMGEYAYPLALFLRESFWHGQIPLWNPLSSCGIPFLAQWNTLTCYPGSLFYLLLPMPWSYDVFCLGHMFFAAIGMYFLATRWTNDRFASALAGTAFGFNGLIWQSIMYPQFLAALAWLPWMIIAMEKAWKEGGRAIVWAALAGAMQMLSGGVEVIIQTWLILGAMCVVRLFRRDVPRGRLIIRTIVIGLLVAGLSSFQIFPFLDLLAHSQRSAGYGSGEMAGVGAMSFWGILNFLVPLFHCVRNSQGVFVQAGQEWLSSYYVGIGTLAFALFALWRVRNARVWFLAGLTLFSLVMALGEPGLVYGVTKKIIPIFGFIRFPVKFVASTTFSLSLLAAIGVSRLRESPPDLQPREWSKAKRLVLALIGLMIVVLVIAWLHPVAGEELPAIAGNVGVRAVMILSLMGVIGVLLRKKDLKLQRLFQCAAVILIWFDVFTHTSNLSPTAPAVVLQPDLVRSFFNWNGELRAGTSRALESQDSFWRMLSTGTTDLGTDTIFRRRALSLDFNLLDHAAKFDGFYPLDLEDHIEIFKRVFFTTNAAPGLKNFVGVSHVSNPTNIFDWVTRDSFLPLVTAGQKPVFVDDTEALQAIFENSFDPVHTVYLPMEANGKVHAAGQPGAKAVLTHYAYQRLEIETESSAPAMVTIAQTFYHPWRAYVDGRRVELWRANYGFQALEVPAGKHQVELRYEDEVFIVGAVVSLLSAFVCVVIWLFWRRKSVAELSA